MLRSILRYLALLFAAFFFGGIIVNCASRQIDAKSTTHPVMVGGNYKVQTSQNTSETPQNAVGEDADLEKYKYSIPVENDMVLLAVIATGERYGPGNIDAALMRRKLNQPERASNPLYFNEVSFSNYYFLLPPFFFAYNLDTQLVGHELREKSSQSSETSEK